jgi:hypothetical protein
MSGSKTPPQGSPNWFDWQTSSWISTPTPTPTVQKDTTKDLKSIKKQITTIKAKISDETTKWNAAKAARTKALGKSLVLNGVTHFIQDGTLMTFRYSTTLPSDIVVGKTLYVRDLSKIPSANFYDSTYKVHAIAVASVGGDGKSFTAYSDITDTRDVLHVKGKLYYQGGLSPQNNYSYWTKVESAWNDASTAWQPLQEDNLTLKGLLQDYVNAGGSPSIADTKPTPTGTAPAPPSDESKVSYNMPSVKWAYFSESLSYNEILLNQGGSPANGKHVDDAKQLWLASNSGSHKGMLQTYSYWKSKLKGTTSDVSSKNKLDPNLPDWYISSSYQTRKFGFQFLYNPGSVSMAWGGTPSVDPGQLMSGTDVTPWIVPSQTASSIQFDLLLNRMPDISLINSVGVEAVAANLSDYYGITASADSMATTNTTYREELQTIQELGTMYDLEYLLGTLVGFREYSALRGRYTSDFGFLMGVPVELHLGKQLRYIGTILDLSVNHTIFTEGMVPVFTNVSITFNRRVEPFNGPADINDRGSLLTNVATRVNPSTSSVNKYSTTIADRLTGG